MHINHHARTSTDKKLRGGDLYGHKPKFGTFLAPKSAKNAIGSLSDVYMGPKNSFQASLKNSIFDDFSEEGGGTLNVAPNILYH